MPTMVGAGLDASRNQDLNAGFLHGSRDPTTWVISAASQELYEEEAAARSPIQELQYGTWASQQVSYLLDQNHSPQMSS